MEAKGKKLGRWQIYSAVSFALVVALLTSLVVVLYQPSFETEAKEPCLLDVSIEGPTKIGVNAPTTYTASVLGGTGDLTFSWSINPADSNVLLEPNGVECVLTFTTATEEPYTLEVKVYDGAGNFGVESMAVYDPPTYPNYYVGVSTAPYSYMIKTDGNGWYYAVDGNTGAVSWSSTNASSVFQNSLNNGKEVRISPGNYTLTTPISLNKGNMLIGSGGSVYVPSLDEPTAWSTRTGTGTVLKAGAAISALIVIAGQNDVTLSNFVIDGSTYKETTSGILVTYSGVNLFTYYNHWTDIFIINCNKGLEVVGSPFVEGYGYGGLGYGNFENLKFANNNYGIYANLPDKNWYNNIFSNIFISYSTYDGIYINGSSPIDLMTTFIGGTIGANKDRGAYFNNCNYLYFKGTHFEINNINNNALNGELEFWNGNNLGYTGGEVLVTNGRGIVVVSSTNINLTPQSLERLWLYNVNFFTVQAVSMDYFNLTNAKFGTIQSCNIWGDASSPSTFEGDCSVTISQCNIGVLPSYNLLSNALITYDSTIIADKLTTNRGYASGTSPITVPHGLIKDPHIIHITPTTETPTAFSVGADATNLYIYFSGGGSVAFDWDVAYRPSAAWN